MEGDLSPLEERGWGHPRWRGCGVLRKSPPTYPGVPGLWTFNCRFPGSDPRDVQKRTQHPALIRFFAPKPRDRHRLTKPRESSPLSRPHERVARCPLPCPRTHSAPFWPRGPFPGYRVQGIARKDFYSLPWKH